MSDIWRTKDEITFVRNIGAYRDNGAHDRTIRNRLEFLERKMKLLRGYIKGNGLRSLWAPLDREQIMTFAYDEVSRIKAAIDKERTQSYNRT